MNPMSILVAGIGNVLLGDDGFGVCVVKKLLTRQMPEHIHVVDFGIRGMDLVYRLLKGYDIVVMADVIQRGGAPGSIYIIEPDLNSLQQLPHQNVPMEAHGMTPAKVFGLLHMMGGALPKHARLVGCEPESFGLEEGGRMGLSGPVEGAVDEAAAIIEELLQTLPACAHA